jgi:hypothetical protein
MCMLCCNCVYSRKERYRLTIVMESKSRILIAALLALTCVVTWTVAKPKTLIQINDDNWSQMLEGEWMVEL